MSSYSQTIKGLKNLNHEEMIKQLSFQISGMARNNRRGAIYLSFSIITSMVAFFPFLFAMVILLSQ